MQRHYTVSNLIHAKKSSLKLDNITFRNIYILTIILRGSPIVYDDTEKQALNNTIYFFCKEENILLPIDISEEKISALFGFQKDTDDHKANIYKTISAIVGILEGRINKIVINRLDGRIYNAYLRIENGKNIFDLNLDLFDAIALNILLNTKIYIDKDILYTTGIKVTKELIENSLRFAEG